MPILAFYGRTRSLANKCYSMLRFITCLFCVIFFVACSNDESDLHETPFNQGQTDIEEPVALADAISQMPQTKEIFNTFLDFKVGKKQISISYLNELREDTDGKVGQSFIQTIADINENYSYQDLYFTRPPYVKSLWVV